VTMLWVILAGGGLVVFLVAGSVSWVLSGSRGIGAAAGAIAAVLAALHTMHAVVLAVGEYEGPRAGYDKLVDEHWTELLVAYTLGPALLLAIVSAAWRLVDARPRVSPRP
jgi:hypothetical protein